MCSLNKKIVAVLKEELSKISALRNGDAFDKEVYDMLAKKLGITKVSHTFWSMSTLTNQHYKRSLSYNFDFSDLNTILGGKTFIVDKPNGQQKWPDMMIVHKGVGFPIEIKSCKSDKIVWNSGLPRPDSLYIFKLAGTRDYTFFLGQNAITEKEYNAITGIGKHLSGFNTNIEEGRWNFYVRNMHSSNQRFITIPQEEKDLAEQQALDLIAGLTWDNSQTTDFSYSQKHSVNVDIEFYTKTRRATGSQCCVELTINTQSNNDAYEARIVMVLGDSWTEVKRTLPDVDAVLAKAVLDYKELQGLEVKLGIVEGLEDFYEDKVAMYQEYVKPSVVENKRNYISK